MPAYVVVRIRVTDPEEFERYKDMVPPTIEAFGGRYVVRGGRFSVVEGADDAERVVLLEFPDYETALGWHASAEYAQAKAQRERSAETEMLIVEAL